MGKAAARALPERRASATMSRGMPSLKAARAAADACKIEHVISDESFERLKAAAKPES